MADVQTPGLTEAIHLAPSQNGRTVKLTRRFAKFLTVATAVVSTVALAPPSHADQTGSYTTNLGALTKVYYPRTLVNGPLNTVPATVPINAVITTNSGYIGFTTQPSGMWWTAYLCAGSTNTICANVSPPTGLKFNAGWSYSTTAFAGYPATTQFHFVFLLNDGQTGSIIPALSPARQSTSQGITVNYTYPDPDPDPEPDPEPESASGTDMISLTGVL